MIIFLVITTKRHTQNLKRKGKKKAQNTKMMTMRKKETLDSYLKWP